MVLERGSICVAVGSGFKPQNLHFCVRCKDCKLTVAMSRFPLNNSRLFRLPWVDLGSWHPSYLPVLVPTSSCLGFSV